MKNDSFRCATSSLDSRQIITFVQPKNMIFYLYIKTDSFCNYENESIPYKPIKEAPSLAKSRCRRWSTKLSVTLFHQLIEDFHQPEKPIRKRLHSYAPVNPNRWMITVFYPESKIRVMKSCPGMDFPSLF